jgi:hypothetical protein
MGMTYYQAALHVLKIAGCPLTTREITTIAIERGLISPKGKTPHATMAAQLYLRVPKDQQLVKNASPGNGRAKQGSVRWALR